MRIIHVTIRIDDNNGENMTLASIQKNLNQTTTTTETLRALDKMQIKAETVLQHKKRKNIIVTVQSSRMHYIDELIYHVVDANGGEWIVPAYDLHLWKILK